MIVKILGTIDLLAAAFFWIFGLFGIIPEILIIIFAFIILIKGVSFSIMHDYASIGDIICSIIMFIAVYMHVYEFIIIITSLYLLQKGIFSWL